LIIRIDGKQVWPPPNNKGVYGHKFEKKPDGSLVLFDTRLDNNLNPEKGGPSVVIEISQKESIGLLGALSRDETRDSPKEKRLRAEMVDALRKLDEIRKEQESSE
jgi:hypothetical protein